MFSNNSISDLFNNVPYGENFKLVFRHSLRPPLRNVENPDMVLLTDEGKEWARQFGHNIPLSIGELHSSHIQRCIQTSQCISEGAGYHKNIIISNDVLGDVFSNNRNLANDSIRKYSLKGVVKMLVDGISVPGLKPIDYCVSNILSYIFHNGNDIDKVDLYCTHDFHIAMLYSKLFSQSNNMNEIVENWPAMLEGMLFWGSIDDFHCKWRGYVSHYEKGQCASRLLLD